MCNSRNYISSTYCLRIVYIYSIENMRRNIQCTHVATGYCCLHSQSQNKELKKKKMKIHLYCDQSFSYKTKDEIFSEIIYDYDEQMQM